MRLAIEGPVANNCRLSLTYLTMPEHPDGQDKPATVVVQDTAGMNDPMPGMMLRRIHQICLFGQSDPAGPQCDGPLFDDAASSGRGRQEHAGFFQTMKGGRGDQYQRRTVSASDEATCAIDADNSVYCWGDNTFGQLGNGEANDRQTIPVAIGTEHAWRLISTGGSYACALTTTKRNILLGPQSFRPARQR